MARKLGTVILIFILVFGLVGPEVYPQSSISPVEAQTPGDTFDTHYTYLPSGNIQTISEMIDNPEVQTFVYDNLYRLTSAEAEGGQAAYGPESYVYDAQGRLQEKPGAGGTLTYGATKNPFHAVSSAGTTQYIYDANGNLVEKRVGGTTQETYSYDVENHLSGYAKTGVTASFQYDGDGQMVSKTINGQTTLYVGGYYEYNVQTQTATKYYLAGSQRTAMRVGTGDPSLLIADALGSTSKVIDASLTIAYEQRYKPWGEARGSNPALPTDYRFTGQREVAELGLDYYNARWYDSYLNRWIQPDNIIPDLNNPLDWDRYSYVRNNPVNFNDPTGHDGRYN